jgi:hypothetical protein
MTASSTNLRGGRPSRRFPASANRRKRFSACRLCVPGLEVIGSPSALSSSLDVAGRKRFSFLILMCRLNPR